LFTEVLSHLNRVMTAGKQNFVGDLGGEGVVVRLQRERREVSLAVAVVVDANVVAGDALVAAHVNDGLSDGPT